jgi:hypothetical protein
MTTMDKKAVAPMGSRMTDHSTEHIRVAQMSKVLYDYWPTIVNATKAARERKDPFFVLVVFPNGTETSVKMDIDVITPASVMRSTASATEVQASFNEMRRRSKLAPDWIVIAFQWLDTQQLRKLVLPPAAILGLGKSSDCWKRERVRTVLTRGALEFAEFNKRVQSHMETLGLYETCSTDEAKRWRVQRAFLDDAVAMQICVCGDGMHKDFSSSEQLLCALVERGGGELANVSCFLVFDTEETQQQHKDSKEESNAMEDDDDDTGSALDASDRRLLRNMAMEQGAVIGFALIAHDRTTPVVRLLHMYIRTGPRTLQVVSPLLRSSLKDLCADYGVRLNTEADMDTRLAAPEYLRFLTQQALDPKGKTETGRVDMDCSTI